jgi:diguanylate cyclase (GGDEF)-like protein
LDPGAEGRAVNRMSNNLSPAEMERLLSVYFASIVQPDAGPGERMLALLAELDDQQKADYFTRRVCQLGEIIMRENDPGDCMYLIESGRVLVYKGDPQDPLILGLRGTGETLGEMALLENLPRSASVAAVEEVSLLGLSRAQFFTLLGTIPVLSQAIMGSFSARLRQSDGRNLQDSSNASQQTQQEIAALREQANRDPLTGLFNRRHMEAALQKELARASKENTPLGILLIDIDFFKKVNDTYGHPCGDRVLQSLAEILIKHVRAGDIPCRYGGEEFLVVLPGALLTGVYQRAEQIRAMFAAQSLAHESGRIRATLSVGVAVYPQHGSTIEELVARADQALYQAKRQGRNQVVVGSL